MLRADGGTMSGRCGSDGLGIAAYQRRTRGETAPEEWANAPWPGRSLVIAGVRPKREHQTLTTHRQPDPIRLDVGARARG